MGDLEEISDAALIGQLGGLMGVLAVPTSSEGLCILPSREEIFEAQLHFYPTVAVFGASAVAAMATVYCIVFNRIDPLSIDKVIRMSIKSSGFFILSWRRFCNVLIHVFHGLNPIVITAGMLAAWLASRFLERIGDANCKKLKCGSVLAQSQ